MPVPSPPDDLSSGPGPDGTLDVLLVEDNPGDARLFEEYLGESSTEAALRHEETLQAGLGALKEERPDVLVIDLGLPDSEGAETVEAAAAAAPEVPIVVLTGQDDLQVALEAQEAGATEYLQKDELGPALVGRTLRWAFQQHRMQAKLRQRDAWIRSITEGLSAGVFRAGPTGHIEYANEAMAQMLGFGQVERLVGQDLTTFYADPTDRGRMLAEEGASEVEIEFEGQDGSTFVGLLSATVAYDGEGKPLHYDGTVTDITERVQRKARLRMLSEAVEQAKEAVLITEAAPLDEPGPRVEYVNSAYEEMTGYAEEEMVGKTPRVLQGPDTEREVLDSLRAALEAGDEWQGETVNYRKDGTPYRVQWNVSPVREEDGSVEHWVSVQRDVTEERAREEQLQRQKNLLEQTQRLAGAWEVDLQSGEVSWSDEIYRIHEVEPGAEIEVEEAIEFYAPEARPRLREAFERCVEEGEPYDLELPLDTAKGNRRWVRTVGAPAQTENGEVVKVAGAFQDITDRKEAEEALKESEELHRATLSNISDTVLLTREDGTFSYVCPNVNYIFGYNEEEVEDLGSISALLGSDPAEDHDFEESREISNVEHSALDASGDRHDLLINIRRVSIQDGRRMYTCRDVTERKQAQRELHKSEERLRETILDAPFPMMLHADDGEVLLVNRAWEEITGYGREEIPTVAAWTERAYDEDAPLVQEEIDRLYRTDETVEEGEFEVRTAEGTVRVWDFSSKGLPYRSENERRLVLSMAHDVTERREAQEALEEREEYLSVTLQSIGDAVVATDRDGCVTEMNSVAEQLTGWSQEEAEGKLLDDVLTLHSARTGEAVESPADEVLRDGTTVGLANHTALTSRDGTEYQIADSAAPIRSGEGDLFGVVLVFRDVTEKYERRRRMERQNDLFAKAQDLANVGAWEYDVRSGEATWTEEVYRIHGLPLDAEPSPEQSLQFYHEEDRPVIEEAFARAIEDGEPYDLELRLSTAEGDERWVRTRGEPQTEDGDVVRVRGTIQDITERKRREIRLEEMQDRMELALDHTSSVLFEIDLEADQVSRMGAYEKFFGMPSEAVDTREQHENRAVHPDDRADVRAFYRELARGERTSGTLEYRTNPEFGDVRWIRDSVHWVEGEEHLLGLARDVTGRKEQRERMRLLAEALEQVGDKVVITDREGRIEFVNEAFEHITGFDDEEVLGETPKVLQSGHHDDAFYRELWETILAGETFRAEMVNERKDGSTYVEDETISPVVDEDGDVSHFVSTGRDVTDRKEREEELKEAKEEAEAAQELFETIFNNVPVMIDFFDADGNLQMVNEHWESVLGWSEAEIKEYSDPTEVLYPASEERRKSLEFMEEAPEEWRDFRFQTKSGEVIDTTWTNVELSDGRRIGIGLDITDRKERERVLRERRGKIEALYEATNRLLQSEGEEDLSSRLADLVDGTLDYSATTIRLARDEKLVPVHVPAAVQDRMPERPSYDIDGRTPAAEAYQSGQTRAFDDLSAEMDTLDRGDIRATAYVPMGTYGLISVGSFEVGGIETFDLRLLEVLGGYAALVLNRLEREQELLAAKEEAERMNRLKSAFLANMSHEIRTPLTSILGFAGAIAEEVGEAEDPDDVDLPTLAQFSSLIERSGQRLMDTLTGVLNLSKLEAGEMDFDPGPVNLVTEAKEAAEEFDPQAKEAGLDLKVQEADAPVWARADDGGLQIALRNLISNAIKYTDEGGEVRVRVRRAGDMTALEVEDTGIGMDPDKAQGFFEAFKQESEGIGREYEGSGLGLTVTKEVLDQMGGSIEVETEKGEGSRFTVRLPRSEPSGEV